MVAPKKKSDRTQEPLSAEDWCKAAHHLIHRERPPALASAATPEQFGPRKVGQTGVAPRTKPTTATRTEQLKAIVCICKGVFCAGRYMARLQSASLE